MRAARSRPKNNIMGGFRETHLATSSGNSRILSFNAASRVAHSSAALLYIERPVLVPFSYSFDKRSLVARDRSDTVSFVARCSKIRSLGTLERRHS